MMIHPSYKEMINAVNQEREDDTVPVVSSRYSIVMATAKRARQIIDGDDAMVEVDDPDKTKPLSIAVQEVYEGAVHLLPEETSL